MPDLSFSIDLSGDLRKRFSELPQPLKSHLREGFAALSNIPEERYADLATFAAEQLPTATLRPPSVKSISTRFGVPEQEARSLLTAVGLVLSLLTGAQETTPEAFADAAAQTQVFPDAARGSFLRFADSVRKSAASQILERSRIGNQLLPSLAVVHTTVDIRPKFVRGRITLAVPVALIYLRTDEPEHYGLCFQATKGQLEPLIKELEDVLRRVESAERWAEKNVESPE